MAKGKYRYNPHTLTYEKIELTLLQKLNKVLTHVTFSVMLGVVLMFAYLAIFPSPMEKTLILENDALRMNYEIMNGKLDQLEQVLVDIQQRDDNIYRMIFEAEPIPYSVRKAGFGGVDRYAELEEMQNMELVVETAKQLDMLTKQMYIQSKSYDEIVLLAKNKEQMLRSIPGIIPISTKDLTHFASGFGYRMHPIYKTIKMHAGVDLTSPIGTKVYASGDGVVNAAQFGKGYGKVVGVDHGFTYSTIYAHLSKILVKKGQKVKRGDVIGLVGNTGTSTGPHLHYEVRKNNRPIDPVNFYMNDLTPEEYDLMLEQASRPMQSFD